MVIEEPQVKTYFTAAESKAMSNAVSGASTRELALKALSNMDLAHEEAGFEFLTDQRNMFVAFIDKKFPKPIEAVHDLEIVTPEVVAVPYKPTPEIFAAFGACKTIEALNDMIDNVITDLTLSNQDTAPFFEYADKLRTAFKMKLEK